MVINKVIIMILIIMTSFLEVPKNTEDHFLITHFNNSSLVIAEKEEIKKFEQISNNPGTITEELKQGQTSIVPNENELAITPEQTKKEDTFKKQNKKSLKSRKKKKKIKRRRAKDLLKAYNKARDNAKEEELESLRFGAYNKIVYKPSVLISKNYWIYKLFPNRIDKLPQNNKNSDSYIEEYLKSYQTIKKATKEEIEAVKKRLSEKKLREKIVIQEYIYNSQFGFADAPESEVKPETLRNVQELKFRYPAYRKYYTFSWSNVIKYGPTINEVENVLIILAFVRFCVYAIRYGIKTAFIICSIGLISAFFYMGMLTDAIVVPMQRLYLCPSLFRFLYEETLYRNEIEDSRLLSLTGLIKPSWTNWKSILSNVIDYFEKIRWWWQDEIIDARLRQSDSWLSRLLVDSSIFDLSIFDSPIFDSPIVLSIRSFVGKAVEYLQNVVIPYLRAEYKNYETTIRGLLYYSILLRAGKNIVPYHIQWHVMFYVLYSDAGGDWLWSTFDRSQVFLQQTLIPEMRYDEIYFLNLFEGTLIGGLVYFTMLAMLHAVFSQYFYIPFWVPNIESHVGKRPKDDIYSGGYTSWQDELKLWEPSPADFKLWFGFLGKGPKDRKNKKKRRRKNKNSD